MRYLITGGSGFIGSNLIEELSMARAAIRNIDIRPPNHRDHQGFWCEQDILDLEGLKAALAKFEPTHVIHLAARADTVGKSLADYEANTRGTENVLLAIKSTPSVERVIITSTQFVHQNKGAPKDDCDFAPHTVYGESKVITEQLTRAAGLACPWTIIRPTNIWGPWHPRYPHEFWRILSKGLYLHPGGGPVTRSYGYVKNVVWQVMQMCDASPDVIDGRVYYVGDEPIDLIEWVNAFSLRMLGRRVRVVPEAVLRFLAVVGDAAGYLGVRSPITSSRLESMTTSNAAPMLSTMRAFGTPPHSLTMAVDDTVSWLYQHYPRIVPNSSGRRS